MNTKDAEIIALYLERNEQAIAQTSQLYGSFCLSVAMNILHNNADAEECVNDTYLKVWQTIPPKTPNPLKPYLAHMCETLLSPSIEKSTPRKEVAHLKFPCLNWKNAFPLPLLILTLPCFLMILWGV